MSFESGSATFRAFYVPGGLPDDAIERFARHAMPPINTLGTAPLTGWVTGRHLLDHHIVEETVNVGGYLRLTLVKAERKIPEALLRAECKMEELAAMQAEGKAFLKRGEKADIRKQVIDRLMPAMPPTLTGIPVVYDGNSHVLYAGAMSEKRMEALMLAFGAATGQNLLPINAAFIAMKRRRVDISKLTPVSFSPDIEDELACSNVGQDLLTWLWFYSEVKGGLLEIDGDTHAVALEGPLMFFMEGAGAHTAVLRNGTPMISTEAKTSLLSGKKLVRAQMMLSRNKEMWSCAFDANDFCFRGLKIPKGEELDQSSWFQSRLLSMDRFMKAVIGYFEEFIEFRADPKKWKGVQRDIHKWVQDRTSKC